MYGTNWNTGNSLIAPKVGQPAPMQKPGLPTRTPPPTRLGGPMGKPKPNQPVRGLGNPTPSIPYTPPMGVSPIKPWGNPASAAPKPGDPSFVNLFMPQQGVGGGEKPMPSNPLPNAPNPQPSAPYPQPSTPYPMPPSGQPISGAVPGAQIHHNMYEGANRGQVRTNPQTGKQEILMGAGGGEQYSWQPYDPNNWGQKQNADLFSRYGSNWTSGSGATSMHAPDITQVLREQLGREPTWQETYDIYYGVNKNAPGIAYNNGVSGR